jgi:hypothetical protein
MSTPAYKKRQRLQAQADEKRQRDFEKKYGLFSKPVKSKTKDFTLYEPKEPYRRETPEYPSCSNNIAGFAPRKESPKYTGTLIKGVATMHKSNAVPIISKEQATDISQMSN